MKIKIFSKKDTLELEKEVNSFMEERVVMDVKYQSMYVATKYNGDGIPIEGKIIDRAMVIYDYNIVFCYNCITFSCYDKNKTG